MPLRLLFASKALCTFRNQKFEKLPYKKVAICKNGSYAAGRRPKFFLKTWAECGILRLGSFEYLCEPYPGDALANWPDSILFPLLSTSSVMFCPRCTRTWDKKGTPTCWWAETFPPVLSRRKFLYRNVCRIRRNIPSRLLRIQVRLRTCIFPWQL